MSELILTNAKLILPDEVATGTLVVREGRIAKIDGSPSRAQGAIDCAGDYLAPGLIELHTDNIERHVSPRPGTLWPCDAAILAHDREIISAGITTCFDAVCIGEVHPKSIRLGIVDEVCGALDQLSQGNALKADHRLHLRCEVSYRGLVDLLDLHAQWSSLGLISVMDHTPGARQYVDVAHYAEYYQGKFNMSDAELESFISERRSDGALYSEPNRRAVVALARARSLPLASHDDATVSHVAEAVRDDAVIAEFPTTIEAAKAAKEAGIAIMMGGPNIVRGRSHTGNVSARDLDTKGLLDIISSDYVPSSALHGALILANASDGDAGSLSASIAMLTATPAKVLGLSDRGRLELGLRADLLRFSMQDLNPVIGSVWREGMQVA